VKKYLTETALEYLAFLGIITMVALGHGYTTANILDSLWRVIPTLILVSIVGIGLIHKLDK